MRKWILALAMLVASSAQADITYRFTGICTESYLQGPDGPIQQSCEPFIIPEVREIRLPDTYVPGTPFSYSGSVVPWLLPDWWLTGQLPESSGPGSVYFDFGVGVFQAGLDGNWLLRYEYYSDLGFTPFFAFGTGAVFTRVPLPGTLALMALGILLAAPRSRTTVA